MDNENNSNAGPESLPEKVETSIGISAENAMIERVSHSGDQSDSEEASVDSTTRGISSILPKEEEEEFIIPERFSKNGRRKAVSFPLKLMKILSSKENEEIIAWLPGGRTFVIKDQEKFTSDILPDHFKQSKYTSFTRKLLRWGFTRIKAGTYTHEMFQKGRLDLVEQMSCKAKVMALPQPAPFSTQMGYPGFPGAMSQLAAIRQQQQHSMTMGGPMGGGANLGGGGMNPSMQQQDALARLQHQDALNAVDREINRVRRLLQEKRMEAAASLPQQQQQQQQFPNPMASVSHQDSLSQQGRLGGMGQQLGMSQPQGSGGLGSIGVMQQAQMQSQGGSSFPSHPEDSSSQQPSSTLNPVDIELEVRRRLRLREHGLNIDVASMPSLREPPGIASLRDPVGMNRTSGGIDPVSTLNRGGGGGIEPSMSASFQRGMMPMSPQQQSHQLLGNPGAWNVPTGNVGGMGGMNPNFGFAAMGNTGGPGYSTSGSMGRTGNTPPSSP